MKGTGTRPNITIKPGEPTLGTCFLSVFIKCSQVAIQYFCAELVIFTIINLMISNILEVKSQ